MNAQLFVRIVSSATASVVLLFGVVLLTGLFLPPTIPQNYRIILGSVMVLYGAYRLVMIWLINRKGENADE